jgi:hypothetical protein
LQSAALATAQADPLPGVIEQVVRLIRGYVATCARNTLGAGATIPDELLDPALVLIRESLASRLPRFPNDDTRKTQADAARTLLRDVAACKFTVVCPATPTTEAVSAPSPRIEPRPRQFTRESQAGL